MQRTKKKPNPIPLAGYLPVNRLIEIIRDAIRAMPKEEKRNTAKELIIEVCKWSSYSQEEAIGVLQSAQFHFLQNVDNFWEVEHEEEIKEKKIAKVIR